MIDFEKQDIEEIIKAEGEVITCTSGLSMYPMLRNRCDMAVIEVPKTAPKKNDVVLYRASSGKLLLHRIIKVTQNEYVIRGDNRYVKEYGVTEKDIIGVLKEFHRNGKRINCHKSKGYKMYVFLNRIGYPFRFLWVKVIIRILVKIKHLIFK